MKHLSDLNLDRPNATSGNFSSKTPAASGELSTVALLDAAGLCRLVPEPSTHLIVNNLR